MAVASPSSVWRRQTKPGLASATALTGVQRGDEAGQQRGVERLERPRDVDLGEVPAAGVVGRPQDGVAQGAVGGVQAGEAPRRVVVVAAQVSSRRTANAAAITSGQAAGSTCSSR